ncbi:MAG: SphA family protein [Janthinobacterium lividum]
MKATSYAISKRCMALLLLWWALGAGRAQAQDPRLPPTNLGITNLQDGNAPAPGWYYMQYIQLYHASHAKDAHGESISDAAETSSLLAMQQVVFISRKRVAGGNLGFTLIVPLASIGVRTAAGQALTSNPSPLGDVVARPLVQWFHKRLFGLRYAHRLEVDLGIPTGAYKAQYAINPGSLAFRVFPHYTFTLSASKKLAFSMRHHLTYYFNELNTAQKPGLTYNFNYSAEYSLTPAFTVELAGYSLTQLGQDSNHGNADYYQQAYGISDTRERVFAYGLGLGFLTPTGLFVELKGMAETAAKNRSEGFRTTLVLSYKIDK